jgi:hypothetical protein
MPPDRSPFIEIERHTFDGFVKVRATTLCALIGAVLAAFRESSIPHEIVEELLGDADAG